jgi:two-component system response regulator PhoP
VEVDTARRAVRVDGEEVHLTRNEYSVLEYLVNRRGRVVSKSELLDHLYAGDAAGSENAVEVFVHQLRRKIEPNGSAGVIQTRRGHGYLVE